VNVTPARLLVAAIAAVVIGTAVCFIGIVAPGVFVIGTRLILLGLLGCIGAGLVALAGPANGPAA
jgi:hypothetical protein